MNYYWSNTDTGETKNPDKESGLAAADIFSVSCVSVWIINTYLFGTDKVFAR